MTDVAASEQLVATERRGHVLVVWLADAARRNALSSSLVAQTLAVLQSSRSEGVRALVIGSRQKAFCAGADIGDMLSSGWLEAVPGAQAGPTPPQLFEAIEADERPVLAAVDGAALGGGVELCLACDLVYAAPPAWFMFPELGLGVLPNTALARLPALVGARAAAELILTRRRIDAAEALRLGLLNEVVDCASAVERAVAVAEGLVEHTPPTALAAAKRHLRRAPDWRLIHAMLADMDAAEWREGTTAFVEKRAPDYQRFWK